MADDGNAALNARFSELSARVARLESELEHLRDAPAAPPAADPQPPKAPEALRSVFEDLVHEMQTRRIPGPAPKAEPDPAAPPAPAAAPAPAPSSRPVRTAKPAALTEVQLTLSPVLSFPRLAEMEGVLRRLPAVRTVVVRDFRNGVATLTVGLDRGVSSEELSTTLSGIEHPRLRVLSKAQDMLELQVDEGSGVA